MRPFLISAVALLVLAGPAQARDDKDEAARCAANVARLDAPLRAPSARSAFYFWSLFLDRYRPIPYDAAAVSREAVRQCGDDNRRFNTWSFIVHMLAASGDLDGAQAVAEERLRLSPSDTAWKEVAEVRLRKGDEAGALEALRHGSPPTPSDARVLARAYGSIATGVDVDQAAALALHRTAEQRWRALAEAQPEAETVIDLIGAISAQGGALERLKDHKAAAETYARIEDTVTPLRATTLDGFEERGVETVLMNAYVSRARASAAAGDRAGVIDSADKAVSLAQTEPFTRAGGTVRSAISVNRWSEDYPARFSVENFRQIGDDLMRVDAPREALPLFKAVVEFRTSVAESRGKPYDGVGLIRVARAQRLAGQPGASLKTIDAGLVLMRAEAPRPTPVPIDRYMQPQIAEGLLEKALALDALGRGAEACAAFREARVTFSPEPTHYPVTSPLLTQLDEAVARPACAKPL